MKSEKQFSNQGNAFGTITQGNLSTPESILTNLYQQNLTSDGVAQILDSLPPGQIVRYFAQNGLEALFEQQEETTEDNYGSNATTLDLDTALEASIGTEMENDLYSIELEEGVTYTLNVSSDELSSTHLVLRDETGARIASDFQEDGEDSTTISFTAPISATYYLDLSDLEDDASGTYNISVSTQEDEETEVETGDNSSEEEANSDESVSDSVADGEESSADNDESEPSSDSEGEESDMEEDNTSNQDVSETTDEEDASVTENDEETEVTEEGSSEDNSTNQDDSETTTEETTDDSSESETADDSIAVEEDSSETTTENTETSEDGLNTEDTVSLPELNDDDISADIFTTSLLDVGSTVESSIDFAGDDDWFAASFEAGVTYDFTLESESDTAQLTIMDSEGTLVSSFENTSEDEGLSFTAEESATYFISASDADSGATEDYLIGVQQQSESDIIA
ncbi:hypothetical protein [Marinomonas ostreistagni]|uniref:Peptidase C-terminal archaeal/bacterial domain-containing protein n=1 Tax=Marinomonas ostreistagni TaxID=359209 RepID=A0ABS0Z9I4_9GAMM|nr:hypothetical protein [Marinomonas ostreistagni]MBJ7550317.1 hypothetical protein [Marinomonas ostreistagni]